MVGADEVVVDRHHSVGRHGKPDALVAVRLSEDGGVDADDFTIHVQQGSARVARVDSSVGLDEVLELAAGARFNGAVLG